jgi:beta-glucosidase
MLDLAVSRHLEMKQKLNLFENPYVDEQGIELNFETQENRALAREIAAKSMVLLKNEDLLPLHITGKRLAVIGPVADDPRNLQGDYSHQAKNELVTSQSDRFDATSFKKFSEERSQLIPKFVTYLEGLKSQVGADGEVLYAPGCDLNSEDRQGFTEALKVAGLADVVILVLGDHSGLVPQSTSGETRDSATLKLPGVQEELARAVLAEGKPTVVVLASGRPYAIAELAEKAGALLQVWIPGEEGGNALADVLFGVTNPAGRLPVTFPRSVGQLPMNYDHKPSGQYSNWYENYTDESVKPLYTFGHGLSYTQFAYSDLELNKSRLESEDHVEISLSLQNTGSRAGEEVVQLYIRDEYASSPRPLKQLCGFLRVGLEAGQTMRVHFDLSVKQLAFYGPGLQLKVEAGNFKVMVGAAADDIRLEGAFEVADTKTLDARERVTYCPAWVEALELA